MAGHESPALVNQPKQRVSDRAARMPQAPRHSRPSLDPATQLAALHRTLTRGSVVKLRLAGTAKTAVDPASARSAPVVQRYTDREDKSRLSENGDLLLESKQALYAADAQFGQANDIGGEVEFLAGDAHADLPKLKLVKPKARENSELAQKSVAWDRKEKEGLTRERGQLEVAKERFIAKKIAEKYTLEAYAALDEEEREEFEGDIQSDVEDFMEAFYENPPAPIEDDPRIQAMETYLGGEAKLAAEGSPIALIASDCGEAAKSIAGFNPDERVKGDVAEPGAVYKYTPSKEKVHSSEWDVHYATIIMTDGPDHVTMENAGAKRSEGFGKLPYDRNWYFEMYGPGKDQSFVEKYAADFGDAS